MTVQTGDQAPDFTLPIAGGGTLTLSDAWRDSPVVLVFFPLAFSGRCQAELCEIRDNLALFEAASVRVIGVSVDSHFSLRAWAAEQGYGFDLASDFWPHGEVAGAYGVFLHEKGFADRASFLIDQHGVVRWSVVTDPGTSRALDAYRDALATL
ncbi:MAG: peroxiredoxin [Microbacterium sp.]|uniref:peroxiredoxin n=1 Tax=Microbacterium sp. TaxID=51671 RepID=UPI003A87F2C8